MRGKRPPIPSVPANKLQQITTWAVCKEGPLGQGRVETSPPCDLFDIFDPSDRRRRSLLLVSRSWRGFDDGAALLHQRPGIFTIYVYFFIKNY